MVLVRRPLGTKRFPAHPTTTVGSCWPSPTPSPTASTAAPLPAPRQLPPASTAATTPPCWAVPASWWTPWRLVWLSCKGSSKPFASEETDVCRLWRTSCTVWRRRTAWWKGRSRTWGRTSLSWLGRFSPSSLRTEFWNSSFVSNLPKVVSLRKIDTYPLTARVVGPPQVTSQLFFSIFHTPSLTIPWCFLPTSSSVCLVSSPLSLCLERWSG